MKKSKKIIIIILACVLIIYLYAALVSPRFIVPVVSDVVTNDSSPTSRTLYNKMLGSEPACALVGGEVESIASAWSNDKYCKITNKLICFVRGGDFVENEYTTGAGKEIKTKNCKKNKK